MAKERVFSWTRQQFEVREVPDTPETPTRRVTTTTTDAGTVPASR